jgi:hypothetical protein
LCVTKDELQVKEEKFEVDEANLAVVEEMDLKDVKILDLDEGR